MGGGDGDASAVRGATLGDASGSERSAAETFAWALIVPCAAIGSIAVYALGPPLGALLEPARVPYAFWPYLAAILRPEPVEHARFGLAVVVPLLLATAAVVGSPRLPRARRALAAWALLGQVATVGLVVACLVAQHGLRYGVDAGTVRASFFTLPTLATAALLAVATIVLARSPAVRRRVGRAACDSRHKRSIAAAAAATLTAIWLLHAINSDASVAFTPPLVWANLPYALDETFAVVNGRTPFVDFTAQYGALWPVVSALSLIVFSKSLLAFTITMSTITAAAMLAIFGVLRRASGSSSVALLLYAPFLATSFFMVDGTLVHRATPANIFSAFPLRYAGPFLLAWLTARRLGSERPRATWPVFAVAGLVVLNNVEFGLPALGATFAAILWTSPERRAADRLAALARSTSAGLLAASAVVCAFTLVRAGALPHLERLLSYAPMYVMGFNATPLPSVLGLHTAMYATYVAAIATATVRTLDGRPDRVLTGMLVWSGVFGLGAASYFVGESMPTQLVVGFSAWALALMLLAVVVGRNLFEHASAWPSAAQVTILFGVGVCACSLAQTPAPWRQIERLTAPRPIAGLSVDPPPASPYLPDPALRTFFASVAYGSHAFYLKRSAPTAILIAPGHRVADAFGVVDVDRYTGYYSITTRERLREVVADLRHAGGNTLIVAEAEATFADVLVRAGFGVLTRSGVEPSNGGEQPVTARWDGQVLVKWVDMRNLRPRFLQGDRGKLVAHYP